MAVKQSAFTPVELKRWILRHHARLCELVPQALGFIRNRGTLTIYVPPAANANLMDEGKQLCELIKGQVLGQGIMKEFPSVAKVEFKVLD